MKPDREAKRLQKEAEHAEAESLRDKIKQTIRATPTHVANIAKSFAHVWMMR